MKKIIGILCVSVFLLSTISITYAASTYETECITTTSEAYIPSETLTAKNVISDYSYEKVTTQKEAKEKMQLYKDKMKDAKKIKNSGYNLGYADDHIVIKIAKEEYLNAEKAYDFYKKIYDELDWNKKAKQYPAAAEIWKFLEGEGYNNYVIAGIIGNLMAEVGGQTLDIKYWTKGNGYYGMCQWSVNYFPGVVGKDLKGQCKFLEKNIKKAFNTWGFLYAKNFNYDTFCNLKNEKEAALAFAECYERCGNASYAQRQKNATIAYNYFME